MWAGLAIGMKRIITFLFLVLLPVILFAEGERPVHRQVRVKYDNNNQRISLLSHHFDIIQQGQGSVYVIADSSDLRSLAQLGFSYEIIHENLEDFYRSRLAGKTMGGYKTLSEIESSLAAIVTGHPNIVVSYGSIGPTLEGRDIPVFKISDNPEIGESEPKILFTAAIHAREVITPEILLYFMNYLVENYGVDSEVTYLVDNREIWFVPVVNPDGYYYNEVTDPWGGGLWRKNRRDNGDGTYGVDLNRNFGYQWGYDDIGSSPDGSDETYRGTAAFSEPETQALRDFITNSDFDLVINFHSFSDLVLYPWSYQIGLYCDDDSTFTSVGTAVNALNYYNPGPGWALYPTNGCSDDWCYGDIGGKSRVPSITIEVGGSSDGFWPPEERILPLITENLPVALYLTDISSNINRALPPNPPALAVPDTSKTGSYQIDWQCNDPNNPPVAYELIEYENPVLIMDSLNDYDNLDNYGFSQTGVGFMGTLCSYSGPATTIERYYQTLAPYKVKTDDTLEFWTHYALNNDVDYAYVEVSTNGFDFSPIAGNITTDSNPLGYNRGHGITGTTAGFWVPGLFDLADFVGQDVYFRISYRDFHVAEAGQGIRIDNLWPVQTFDSARIISSTLTDTTEFLSGRTSGMYYYRVRAMDADGQWSAFSTLDSIVVRLPDNYVCGDVNADESVNLIDILYLIDYVYGSPPGPEPDPHNSGDIDGSSGWGHIDLIDILHLIAYLYNDPPGSQPDCPH